MGGTLSGIRCCPTAALAAGMMGTRAQKCRMSVEIAALAVRAENNAHRPAPDRRRRQVERRNGCPGLRLLVRGDLGEDPGCGIRRQEDSAIGDAFVAWVNVGPRSRVATIWRSSARTTVRSPFPLLETYAYEPSGEKLMVCGAVPAGSTTVSMLPIPSRILSSFVFCAVTQISPSSLVPPAFNVLEAATATPDRGSSR